MLQQPRLCQARLSLQCSLLQRARFARSHAELTATCVRRRREVRHLRLVREACDAGARLRRVQLRQLRRPLRHLRRHRHIRRVLLQGVHHARKRRACRISDACTPRTPASPNVHVSVPSLDDAERRVSKDRQPRQRENRSVLRTEKMCAPVAPCGGAACAARCIALCCRQRLTRVRPLRDADGFKKR